MSPERMREMFKAGEDLYLAERAEGENALFSELPEAEKHEFVKRAAENNA